MGFNFQGTFTKTQWRDFSDFTAIQKYELEARKRWIDAELTRTGQVTCVYDDFNMPVSYDASPTSYIGKLLLAYRMLGGVPERDMLLRTRDQVVFLQRGVDEYDDPPYTNGRQDRGSQRFDRSLCQKIERLKGWQLEIIKSKREIIEYKIKRAMDYADQLSEESKLLKALIDNSLVDTQIMDTETAMLEPNTYNIPTNDGDPFGLFIGKPADGAFEDAGTAAAQGNERVPQSSV